MSLSVEPSLLVIPYKELFRHPQVGAIGLPSPHGVLEASSLEGPCTRRGFPILPRTKASLGNPAGLFQALVTRLTLPLVQHAYATRHAEIMCLALRMSAHDSVRRDTLYVEFTSAAGVVYKRRVDCRP
jgi:hypothetical protein